MFSLGSDGGIFGAKCESVVVSLVFVTTERAPAADIAFINALRPKLSVIVDSGDRADFDAQVDSVDIMGTSRLRLIASGVGTDIVDAISAAKRRVSVASSLAGKSYNVSHYAAAGSRAPLAAALRSCGLRP